MLRPALIAAAFAALFIAGCASPPPRHTGHACNLFDERPGWYKYTRRAATKWKVHGPVLLAIMRQESGFDADARPRRKRFLGIPLRRPSSAFGYAQALDGTWKLYKRSTNRFLARRDSFSDAMDFIGWYVAQTRKRLKISPRDGYRNYLAYHEGWTGYARKTYRRKKWLTSVAQRVAGNASRYRAQLALCGIRMP